MNRAGHVSGRPDEVTIPLSGSVVTSTPEPPLTVEGGTSRPSAFDMVYRCFERQWHGLPYYIQIEVLRRATLYGMSSFTVMSQELYPIWSVAGPDGHTMDLISIKVGDIEL